MPLCIGIPGFPGRFNQFCLLCCLITLFFLLKKLWIRVPGMRYLDLVLIIKQLACVNSNQSGQFVTDGYPFPCLLYFYPVDTLQPVPHLAQGTRPEDFWHNPCIQSRRIEVAYQIRKRYISSLTSSIFSVRSSR